jgi:hypothetical protein
MPRGFPDSWLLWGAGRISRSVKGNGFGSSKAIRAGGGGGVSNHYTYKFQKLVLYRPILDAELKTPKGHLWRELNKRGKVSLYLAKRQVGKRTGELERSIKMEHKTAIYGQELRIGSDNKIAYLHHEGTRPHLIKPKDAPQLVFMSKGRIIRTQLVRHPGTKPNRYLSDQLFIFQDIGTIYRGKSFPKPKI